MKKWKYLVSACALSMIIFTGCSGEDLVQTNSSSDMPLETTNEAQNSVPQEETDIMKYEKKYLSGEFTMEDYRALAALYGEQGSVRKQRDMLEQSYRLYEDNEAFKLLQDISVNLAEEGDIVRQQAMLLYQNLVTPEYRQEAIHVIESGEWFDALMPKLGEGVRKYFLQEDGKTTLLVCVGYDEEGKSFSNVWHLEGEDKLTLLNYSSGVAQILETSLKEEKYDGNFSLWVLDGTSGSILNEQGTFANGIYSGEYTLKIHKDNAEGDPFDLWSNRENMEYTSYTVKADEKGQGEMEQFAAKMMSYPAIRTYEVDADAENNNAGNDNPDNVAQTDAAKSQVRIFDGNIQLLQDGIWITLGSVEQYMEQDPFRAYVKQNTQYGNEELGENEGIDFDNLKLPVSEKEQDKNNTTQKPPAKKPAAQSPSTPAKPQTPTTPKPPATTVPAPNVPDDDDDDDGDNGGSADNGSDNGSDSGSDNGGGDSGNDDGGGSDTDVEWTPDLM